MTEDIFPFEGFEIANTTPVPDVVFDRLLKILSGAELKVLLYIIRRTHGFKKETDAISLTQFQKGIKTRDGKQLDEGCGISNRTVISKAQTSLEKRGLICRKHDKDAQGDDAPTSYTIRFRDLGVVSKPYHPSIETVPPVVTDAYYRSAQSVPRVVSKPYPQETVIQETVIQESTYTQAASALAQSTHAAANGENNGHQHDGTADILRYPDSRISGNHYDKDVSGSAIGERDDATPTGIQPPPSHASDSSEHHVLPVVPGIPGDHRRADVSVDPQIAPPANEVYPNIPAFLTPPTDEVPLLALPPNTSSTPGRVEREAAPASGAKPQRKPKKVADGKTSTIGQSRISAIIDCMDATIQQLTGDPQFCFSRSKKAQDTIWDTLIKDRKEGQGVTPAMLRATITRMYNTPKDARTGFDWKENMSIPAICNNFDKFSIGLAAKQPPKVAPVELDAEALEEERRRLEFAIKHAERWAKPAPMAPAPHAVVPIVAKGSGR